MSSTKKTEEQTEQSENKGWGKIYLLEIVVLAVLVALFYLFTITFS
ncbi:hypothetical protein BXY85_3575 [Roseivirga pacifica]|uniref:Uncharacterized protein n=1 Tax=Roseivirga pacifica TaxID=1267423 RepID=A0A1I0QGH3_9BACT|nr:hypothetical protein [Roseivirga pacifica]RKQ42957.1 hypothetical protein BXY85_3575 [Roseivirga pacifica]SEW25947.1 hypothetical protein SAMN05216290_2300 [Roseivirga pacifica]|tara:strand:- start:354 stop:491 length:138 start_codon:yes stop_codon:yes gene_type:complete